MAVIEYLGYRLIAMTCLPLTKESLKVGTADQGASFHYDDPVNFFRCKCLTIKELIKGLTKIGQKLNLRPHKLSCSQDVISWPADLEGHIGTDGRR